MKFSSLILQESFLQMFNGFTDKNFEMEIQNLIEDITDEVNAQVQLKKTTPEIELREQDRLVITFDGAGDSYKVAVALFYQGYSVNGRVIINKEIFGEKQAGYEEVKLQRIEDIEDIRTLLQRAFNSKHHQNKDDVLNKVTKILYDQLEKTTAAYSGAFGYKYKENSLKSIRTWEKNSKGFEFKLVNKDKRPPQQVFPAYTIGVNFNDDGKFMITLRSHVNIGDLSEKQINFPLIAEEEMQRKIYNFVSTTLNLYIKSYSTEYWEPTEISNENPQ